ncbi:MAG: YceD family protein [Candidatus Thiodiazotropha sp.]
MSQRIPDRLDPWRYADLGKTVSGVFKLDALPRLCRCLSETEGEVHFDLRFERDSERRAVLTGSITADLVLECQRCLEAVSYPVEANVSLAFVEGIEQAGLLPEALDPCLVEDDRLVFKDLIEDELLLLLPQVAMHETGACPAALAAKGEDEPVETENRSDRNPFAVLADLKRDKE